jgi:small GTP-binding protein
MDSTQSVKAVLLGESGVGKTCIIARFINGSFESNIMSTTGASYAGKTMIFQEFGGQCVKFEIWDTAGQEKYRSLTKIFYRDAKVIVFVYDITTEYSFNQLKDYWYEETINTTEKTPLMAVVANKSDLYPDQKVNNKDGKEFAEKINAIFQTTSAMSDTGINTLFENIGKKIIMPDYDYKNSDNTAQKDYSKKIEKENKEKKIKLEQRNSTDVKDENKRKCC